MAGNTAKYSAFQKYQPLKENVIGIWPLEKMGQFLANSVASVNKVNIIIRKSIKNWCEFMFHLL